MRASHIVIYALRTSSSLRHLLDSRRLTPRFPALASSFGDLT
jgi:hypothetical protein